MSDVWKFSNFTWTWIAGPNFINAPGNYISQGDANPLTYPPCRDSAETFVDSKGQMWLFGGVDGSSNFRNDLWRFNGATWTWVSGSNAANSIGVYVGNQSPGGRCDQGGWIDSKDNIWIFGGRGRGNSTALGNPNF